MTIDATFKTALVYSREDLPDWVEPDRFSDRGFDSDHGCLLVLYNGKVRERWDGGEPEDNTFCRDWNWVPSTINRAYEAGVADGRAQMLADLKHLPTYARLAADMLDLAADEFADHGCNDLKTPAYLTEPVLASLADLLDEANSGGHTGTALAAWRADNPDDTTTSGRIRQYMVDFAIMQAMAYWLRKLAGDA